MGLQAQTHFSKVFGRPFPYLSPITDAIAIGDTSYLLISYPYDYTKDTSKIRLLLIDKNGTLNLTKDYGKTTGLYGLGKVIKYSEDMLVICGYETINADTFNAMILYITPFGDSLDMQTFNVNNSRLNFIADVYVEANNLILCGFADKSRRQLFVRKQDKNGNILWHFIFGAPNLDETAASITPTVDGGYIIVGDLTYPGLNDFRVEGLILKLNKFGQQEWVRYTGEFEYNYAYTTIKPSGDGYYYLCGGWSNNKLAFPNTWYESGSLLAKIDEQGNVIWQKRYWKEIAEATLNDIVVLPNGEFVACGNDGLAYTWPEKEISSLAKFSSNGDIIWSRQYDYNPVHNERLYSIIQTPDNGFLMVGDAHEIDTLGLGAASDGWVLKVDSAGCEIMNCVSSDTEPEIEEESFMVYPNPVSSLLQIQFEQNETGLLRIFNANGQEMFLAALSNEPEIQVNMSTYPNGVYWVNIQTSDQVLTKKIVKVK
jgi:Secretion system C-terminal sorting domain